MRAMRKKNKHIHVTATHLLHIRIRNLEWCKCGHCKNKARELDCLCCREVNVMLFFWLKSWSVREASRHADFMGNCLTVSHTCLLYLPRR